MVCFYSHFFLRRSIYINSIYFYLIGVKFFKKNAIKARYNKKLIFFINKIFIHFSDIPPKIFIHFSEIKLYISARYPPPKKKIFYTFNLDYIFLKMYKKTRLCV